MSFWSLSTPTFNKLYLVLKTTTGKPPAPSTFGSENTKSLETKHNLYNFTGRKITQLASEFMPLWHLGYLFFHIASIHMHFLLDS